MNRDFAEMLSALSEAGAEFLIVGAHALAAHGAPRATGDLDIWIRPTQTMPVASCRHSPHSGRRFTEQVESGNFIGAFTELIRQAKFKKGNSTRRGAAFT